MENELSYKEKYIILECAQRNLVNMVPDSKEEVMQKLSTTLFNASNYY